MKPLAERFDAKIVPEPNSGCWLWVGAYDRKGYGAIFETTTGRALRAHRVAYELYVGPIPKGLILDHLCRNRICVNPAHLEPVSNRVNILRGSSPSAKNARKTHCKHGHEFTPDNTGRNGEGRRCRSCDRDRQRLVRRLKQTEV